MKKKKSIEELREELARQILEIALEDENPQYKLDAFKATVTRGKEKPPDVAATPDGMSIFQARIRKAEEQPLQDKTKENGSDKQAEVDC